MRFDDIETNRAKQNAGGHEGEDDRLFDDFSEQGQRCADNDDDA
ncbi:MAG: hypothetical protein ACD_41C00371G0002 [uncultured bacterium]|nr:MAG: hypothetical protein ACD_41C00371G0002 [uncultured bacterium]